MTEPATISHRQHILADLLQHPTLAAAMYTIAEEAVLGEKRAYESLVDLELRRRFLITDRA